MPSVNDGFSYSDFTNKQDFTNKINGKGQPSGYVLTTNGTKSYWAAGGGGGQGLQGLQGFSGSGGGGTGVQGLQGRQGVKGSDGINGINGANGFQGIQGISGSGGGSANFYYTENYYNLQHFSTPIDINSVCDDACGLDYKDEFDQYGYWSNHKYRDVTITPVTTTDNNGKMVVDERSPFAFSTCYTDVYADDGTLAGVTLGNKKTIPVLYWKPNAMSRSYLYYKDGETGAGGLGRYNDGGPGIRNYYERHEDFGGYPFVLGIDLDWYSSKDIGRNFRRASQTDHYFLIDNNDGCGGDAVNLMCMKIFIKDVIQIPVDGNMPYGSPPNFIMDPYKNVRFDAMDNGFIVRMGGHTLLHLCIRRFPNINPKLYPMPVLDIHGVPTGETIDPELDYTNFGGDTKDNRISEDTCDTLFVSLDWTHYLCNESALSDTIRDYQPFNERMYYQSGFYINGDFYFLT